MRHTLAILLLSAAASATPIETYRLAGDGDDWAPAFERAQIACRVPGVNGCSVELGARTYWVSRAIDVCTPLSIVGTGAGFSRTSSTIQTTRTTAIRTWNRMEGCPFGVQDHGTLRLEHVALLNYAISRPGDAAFYGLDVKTRISVSDVGIYGFVQAIRMICTLAQNSGCNVSTFENVDAIFSEHSGVYLLGDNSNASLFSRVRADSNCRYADRWNAEAVAPFCLKYPSHVACTSEHYRCAGFQDLSFLGNTFVGCSAASETTALPPLVRYAGYVFAGANQATTGIGLYAENDTAPQWADARCNLIGGQSAAFAGPSGQFHGTVTPALAVVNAIDPANSIRVDFGQSTNLGGTVMGVQASGVSTAWPWRLKASAISKSLFWDVANNRMVLSLPHMTGNVLVPDPVVIGGSVCSPGQGCEP